MLSRNSSPSGSISTKLTRNSSPRRSSDVKSSSFYPTTMSPIERVAIVEHMDSHYRRLQKVKAVVDTTPPKSYQLSRSPSPSRSGGSSRPHSRSSLATNDTQYTQINRHDVLQSTSKINYYLEAMRREQQRLFTQLASPNFRRPKSYNSVTNNVTPSRHKHHDLIDKHSDHFTNPERLFMPRVLKSNAKSKLRENRWYNPPRRKEMKRTSSNNEIEEYEKEWESDMSIKSTTASTRDESEDEFSRDKSQEQSLKRWFEEDTFATDNSSKVIKNASNKKYEQQAKKSLQVGTDFSKQREKLPSNKNEELPYLQFIVDVTNDILVRGIYTNKVLKQVFASHMERRKNELSMEKMETALRQLQIDLDITDDVKSSENSFGYGCHPSMSTVCSSNKDPKSKSSNAKFPNNHVNSDSYSEEDISVTSKRSKDKINSISNAYGKIESVASSVNKSEVSENIAEKNYEISEGTFDKDSASDSDTESVDSYQSNHQSVKSASVASYNSTHTKQSTEIEASNGVPYHQNDDFY